MKHWNPDRARALIDERGIKRTRLAAKCGIAPDTLTKVLNGKPTSLAVLKWMAQELNCSVEYLTGESNDRGGTSVQAS